MPLDLTRPVDAGEIFWIEYPPQTDNSEQYGRRPYIVMSRRLLNSGNTIVVVPMSTKISKASDHKVLIPVAEIIKEVGVTWDVQTSVALCNQVRVVDKRKVENRIGRLSQNAVLAVQLGLAYLFDLR